MKKAFFQSFEDSSDRDAGPDRLLLLQAELKKKKLLGYLVPRTDVYQGEYVAKCDERLSWLTGFTGSAGICVVGQDAAGVFVDGRYDVQAKNQTRPPYEVIQWNKSNLIQWIKNNIKKGNIGFDPWLHSYKEIISLTEAFEGSDIKLVASNNLIDRIWADRPSKLSTAVLPYPIELAGLSANEKCRKIAKILKNQEVQAAVITLPDSIAWLLNLRGNDIVHNPVAHAFLIIQCDTSIQIFCQNDEFSHITNDLGINIKVRPEDEFSNALSELEGSILVDEATVPFAVSTIIKNSGGKIILGNDPISLPKACKNSVELDNARLCHSRDAAYMCEFLSWVDSQNDREIDEIDVVIKLESIRRQDEKLKEISFDTIAAAGPNAALPHYRVNYASNSAVKQNNILLVDSGGQYLDGTTDITRTIAIGKQSEEVKIAFTRVLKGLIAISKLKFPIGTCGRDIDAFARAPLWEGGQDFAHGTGHGVGHYLSVHEGPHRISKFSNVAFKEGMIVSNEPGFYHEGKFGIRIENLILVQKSEMEPSNSFLEFETLSFVPIDRRLISVKLLNEHEIEWINNYHLQCWEKVHNKVDTKTQAWLENMTKPIEK